MNMDVLRRKGIADRIKRGLLGQVRMLHGNPVGQVVYDVVGFNEDVSC